MNLISYVYLFYIHRCGDGARGGLLCRVLRGGAMCAEPWIIKIDPLLCWLVLIEICYAAASHCGKPSCHVSLHLAAWAYLMFCQSLWCSCQEHSCSNSPRVSLCGNYFKSCIFQLTFWCPSLWASVESFHLHALMRLSVYLLKDPVLYVSRDGCVLWRRCVF